MRQLPQMNEYHETPGLHVVSIYAQVHTLEEIDAVVEKFGIKYPIAMDGAWELGYSAPVLPQTWIVNPEGKVVFVGRSGYADVLKKELAQVKYPGLGRANIHESLIPAAKAFADGDYAGAYKLAEKIYDETDSEQAEEDADYIMERIDGRLSSLEVRAETAEVMDDYRLAMACWEEIATKFKGLDDAEDAPERLKKLQESDKVKSEIKAKRELLRRMMALDVKFQTVDDEDAEAILEFRKDCLRQYYDFSETHGGTGAADRADELIEIFERLIGPEETEKLKAEMKGDGE